MEKKLITIFNVLPKEIQAAYLKCLTCKFYA